MATSIRLMSMDDVNSNADLEAYLMQRKKLAIWLATEFMIGAGIMRAMLRPLDRTAGKRRARQVARPLVVAAVAIRVIAQLMMTCLARFKVAYAPELEAARRRTPPGPRRMRMDG